MYEVRNKFQTQAATGANGASPVKFYGANGAANANGAQPIPYTGSSGAGGGTGPMSTTAAMNPNNWGQGTSGPGHADANVGANRFLPNGQIMLSAYDKDAARLNAQNPNMYVLPTDFAAHQGWDNGGGTAADQGQWLKQQISAANAASSASTGHTYDSGGFIPEDVTGVGQNTGQRYRIRAGERIMNQQGQSIPGVPQDYSDYGNGIPDKLGHPGMHEEFPGAPQGAMDPQAMAQLQAMMGRRLIRPTRGGPLGHQRTNENGPESKNTSRAVNAPVIRITADQVREMANNPRLHDFLSVLMEAESRGGVQVSSGQTGGVDSGTSTGGSNQTTDVSGGPTSTAGPDIPPAGGEILPPPESGSPAPMGGGGIVEPMGSGSMSTTPPGTAPAASTTIGTDSSLTPGAPSSTNFPPLAQLPYYTGTMQTVPETADASMNTPSKTPGGNIASPTYGGMSDSFIAPDMLGTGGAGLSTDFSAPTLTSGGADISTPPPSVSDMVTPDQAVARLSDASLIA